LIFLKIAVDVFCPLTNMIFAECVHVYVHPKRLGTENGISGAGHPIKSLPLIVKGDKINVLIEFNPCVGDSHGCNPAPFHEWLNFPYLSPKSVKLQLLQPPLSCPTT